MHENLTPLCFNPGINIDTDSEKKSSKYLFHCLMEIDTYYEGKITISIRQCLARICFSFIARFFLMSAEIFSNRKFNSLKMLHA